MPIRRIENAISCCELHIRITDNGDPKVLEIHSYLVYSVVLIIISEYEVLIERLFAGRANNCGDEHIASYVRKQLNRKFRSPDISKINQTLGDLGQDYLDTFKSAIENTEFHAAWDNIMRARHAIVHKQGTCNLTFNELITSYQKTKQLLTELVKVLGLADTIDIYLNRVR